MKNKTFTMVSKEVINTLKTTDMGTYLYCVFQHKGVRHHRRVHKGLKPRQVKHLLMF